MDLSARRPGPDVVRTVAMAGVVVMNYHGYLINRGAQRNGGWPYELFNPFSGPLSTRFAATFVLTAGVGVTLMTRSSIGDADRTIEMRWRLARRGLVLYAVGVLFDFIWPGTILPYYGLMFVIAAGLFTLRSRWVLVVGVGAALCGWSIRWWRLEQALAGNDTTWLTNPGPRSPRGLVFDVVVNGTHPLFPWLAFLCAGIVLGRMLPLPWWRPAVATTGLVLYFAASVVATLGSGERTVVLLSDAPLQRGIVYVASALGTALLAFAAISWLADRYAHTMVIDWLRRAGQMSLTIYFAHAFVFVLLVDQIDLIRPGSLTTALTFAAIYWVLAIWGAVEYQRRYGRGPAELVYRRLTG